MDSYTYTYDGAHNQSTKYEKIQGVEKGTTIYTYNELNRLKTVTEPGTSDYIDPTGHWRIGDEDLNDDAKAEIIALTVAYNNATEKEEKKKRRQSRLKPMLYEIMYPPRKSRIHL